MFSNRQPLKCLQPDQFSFQFIQIAQRIDAELSASAVFALLNFTSMLCFFDLLQIELCGLQLLRLFSIIMLS